MSTLVNVPVGEQTKRSKLPTPLEAIECPMLEQAARDLLARPEIDGDQFSEMLAALCSYVTAARSGPVLSMDPLATSARGRQMLDLLRAELVRGWSRTENRPDTETVLVYLIAFERVSDSMEQSADLSDLANALSGADGLELVVEVAHDLRSPLTSILFLAETLAKGQSGPVSQLQLRQLGLIYSAALGLSTMASNVMEMARGGTRLAEEEPSPFSISETFESVRDIVQPMAEEKGLSVRLLPPASDRRLGSPQALNRVLLNLTTNAIKFTEDGFVELTGEATSLTSIWFSVRDTGNGIPPNALETLYDPFRRTPRNDRCAFSSTGLGLALCRRLIAAMGSELQVESRPGWGTRFSFDLDLPPARSL